MKYIIDIDAFSNCLDCLDSILVNGEHYIAIPILKEFINRFPKDPTDMNFDIFNTEPPE